MLPTIRPTENLLLAIRASGVSVILNRMILAEYLEDVVVASRVVSAAGHQRVSAGHQVVARTGAVVTIRGWMRRSVCAAEASCSDFRAANLGPAAQHANCQRVMTTQSAAPRAVCMSPRHSVLLQIVAQRSFSSSLIALEGPA